MVCHRVSTLDFGTRVQFCRRSFGPGVQRNLKSPELEALIPCIPAPPSLHPQPPEAQMKSCAPPRKHGSSDYGFPSWACLGESDLYLKLQSLYLQHPEPSAS